MDNQDFSRYKGLLMTLAVFILLVAFTGAFDLKNVPYSGYTTEYADGNITVIRIYPDSPAQKAGFMIGDIMISDGGIDAKDSRVLTRRPRAKIGETRPYVLERDGKTVSVDLTFTGLPGRQIVLNFAMAVIGFCFLIFGLLAYFKIKNKSTTLLALVFLCIGFFFVPRPYIFPYTLRMIFLFIVSIAVIFGLAILLHFMMTFPKEKAMLKKKSTTTVLYGPAVLLILFALFLEISQPETTSALNIVLSILSNLFILVYFVLSVIALLHSYVKATPEERESHGLRLMLYCTIIGLVPVFIESIFNIFAPTVVLPGVDFFAFAFVLIPVSFALACIKSGSVPASIET